MAGNFPTNPTPDSLGQGNRVFDVIASTVSPRARMGDGRARADTVSLLLLVGIPGSGKSTWARELATVKFRCRVVSTDAIRAMLYGDEAIQGNWQQIWQQVMVQWRQGIEAIQRGDLDGLIYDATNARRRHRRETIAAARATGFTHITLVWFDLPLSVALERNRGRSRPVPSDIIAAMHRQLQGAPPSLAEGVDQVIRYR